MAPKRARTSTAGASSSSAPPADDRFVTLEGLKRYVDGLHRKTPVPERGFVFQAMGAPFHFKRIIDFHRWDQFVKHPEASVTSVVREFYANAPNAKDGKVFVRGKWVEISRSTINAYYGLVNIENEGYLEVLEDVPYDGILDALCVDGADWKLNKEGMHVSFPQHALRKYPRAWYHFLVARLMPAQHISDVIRDRAILLYAIMVRHSVDVGRIIEQQMQISVRTPSLGLYFPSMITAMCARAGVQWSPTEEYTAPRQAITEQLMHTYKIPAALAPAADMPDDEELFPPPPPPAPSMEARMDHLEQQVAHMDGNIVQLSRMVQQMAAHMGLSDAHFPSLHTYGGTDGDGGGAGPSTHL